MKPHAAVRLPTVAMLLGLACSATNEAPPSGAGGATGAAGTVEPDSSAGQSGGGGSPDVGAAGVSGVAGAGASTSGAAGATGGAPDAGSAGATAAPTCADPGAEPTDPPACATLVAMRTTTNGVPSDESTLDTTRIQAAINACVAGQAVKLTASGANTAFLSGALNLKAGVALWIDAGATLFASRNPRDFDASAGKCGGSGTGNSSCNGLINAKTVTNAAVVGAGTIDGRGGEVVAGNTSTWWELEKADAGELAAPRLVQVTNAKGFVLHGVTLKNAPKFHVSIQDTDGFTVWGVTIATPGTAPNTDGIDPAASTNGVIAHCKISTGDDNIAIKGSGPPVVSHILVAHNHFGAGHGMSIGSETYGGVADVSVCDLSLDGTQNGLRIKSDSSRGGVVQRITYADVCMRDVVNPIVMDAYYSTATGNQLPDYRAIVATNVHVLGGGAVTLRAYDAAHPLTMTFDNVVFDTPPTIKNAQDAHLVFGPGPVSFTASGTDVTIAKNVTATVAPRDCRDAWVTF